MVIEPNYSPPRIRTVPEPQTVRLSCCLRFSSNAGRVRSMSTKAQAILDEIKALPVPEQREVAHSILRQLTIAPRLTSRRRTIADVAGKYHARPDREAKDHDRGFAEAVA